jgi:hypothetical protein
MARLKKGENMSRILLSLSLILSATLNATTKAQPAALTQAGVKKRSDNSSAVTQGPGAGVMEMDHSHRFILTRNGGRIAMQRYTSYAPDSAAVARLRQHIEEIAQLFVAGDFRLPPGAVSSHEAPGTRMMAAKVAAIRYAARSLPRGAEVVISSRDASAIDAIHAFLRFHKAEHRALESRGH